MIAIDTQILLYTTIPSEHTALAVKVRLKDGIWIAPPLWRSEFRNGLAGYLRREAMTIEEARIAFDQAERLILSEEMPSTLLLIELIQASKCTAYDLEFVAVAQSLGIKLVTNDKEVLAAFPEIAVSPARFVN